MVELVDPGAPRVVESNKDRLGMWALSGVLALTTVPVIVSLGAAQLYKKFLGVSAPGKPESLDPDTYGSF